MDDLILIIFQSHKMKKYLQLLDHVLQLDLLNIKGVIVTICAEQ